jgi:cell division protein FtsB
VELFNKSERTIGGVKPQTAGIFETALAEKLLKMYPSDLIKASEAKVISSDEDIQLYVEKLEEENKQLIADKELLEKEVKDLQEGDKTKLKKEVKNLQEELGKVKLELSAALAKDEDKKNEPSFPE